jgi:hypothetical protein
MNLRAEVLAAEPFTADIPRVALTRREVSQIIGDCDEYAQRFEEFDPTKQVASLTSEDVSEEAQPK